MKRVISPSGIRTALIAGLIVLVLTPAALASNRACSGAISAPGSARQGSSFTVTATAVQGDRYAVWLFGGEGDSFLTDGDVSNNGNFSVTVTVPAHFATGGATVLMDMLSPSTCDYGSGITILAKLTISPGITLVIPPALTTTTTTAAPQATTTTVAPQVATTATTDQTSTTSEEPEETTTSVVEGVAATSSSTSEAVTDSVPDSTSTSLITAAPNVDSGGGQPWSAWITGGLVGLLLGAVGMLAAVRKGVLKI